MIRYRWRLHIHDKTRAVHSTKWTNQPIPHGGNDRETTRNNVAKTVGEATNSLAVELDDDTYRVFYTDTLLYVDIEVEPFNG